MDGEPETLLHRALGLQPHETVFPWQKELLNRMIHGPVPDIIDIPTGLGKTSVIAVWLVARHCGAQLPRRLVYCLPTRVLVEQTRARAVRWAQNADLLAGVAQFEGNQLRRYNIDWSDPKKVAVVTLMGGETQSEWREYPENPVIIVGTQDMLLSRALNRGFAMAPQLWPVDFGFINVDALWVMDEVQLMGPGRTTSVQLQHFWDGQHRWGSRRTIWMSATLGTPSASSVPPPWMSTPERREGQNSVVPLTFTNKDLQHAGFKSRWTAPKELEPHLNLDSPDTPQAGRRKKSSLSGLSSGPAAVWTVESTDLIERILREAKGDRLVLVVLNQVKRACHVYARLKEGAGAGLDVVLLHARIRPRERKAIQETKLEAPIPAEGRIIVATQVLEAGVDIDADALFTELCPWPSLVQRLGRLNRKGQKTRAVAVIFEPPQPKKRQGESSQQYEERRKREAALPYTPEALDEARQTLEKLMASGLRSVSPETLAQFPATLPLEGPVLRDFDLHDLFDTDPDLTGGHCDISHFIRAVDRDVDAYLLWRRIREGLAPDDQVPVHPDELCPVPFYEARSALEGHEVWILTLATGRRRGAAWRRARAADIHAGDTVMVDITAGSYEDELGWRPGSKQAPGEIVDRWTRADGTMVRAWVRFKNGTSQLVEEIDDRIVGARGHHEDPRSFAKRWIELLPHLREAKAKACKLAADLQLPKNLKRSVVAAALWHDVGKALEREANGKTHRPFQDMLVSAGHAEQGHPKVGVLYAKSNGRGGKPAGFRHELASLLSFLRKVQDDDLAAFLILAHHGKVRLMPTAWDENDPRDLCGVYPGDRIPPSALPCGGNTPLVLDPEVLLPAPNRPGWQGRIQLLLKNHGPFLLAFLEGLVRVADWRAS